MTDSLDFNIFNDKPTARSDQDAYTSFMVIACINAIVPMFLLEYWMRSRGFGGQDWYNAAWHYVAYGRFIYWGVPLIGVSVQIMGLDFMKSSVAWYIALLSLPTLSFIGTVGDILL